MRLRSDIRRGCTDPFEVVVVSHAAQKPIVMEPFNASVSVLPPFLIPMCHTIAPGGEPSELFVR